MTDVWEIKLKVHLNIKKHWMGWWLRHVGLGGICLHKNRVSGMVQWCSKDNNTGTKWKHHAGGNAGG